MFYAQLSILFSVPYLTNLDGSLSNSQFHFGFRACPLNHLNAIHDDHEHVHAFKDEPCFI